MADSFHFSVNIISRGKGKSAVASAAYISGEKITNEWDGITHDYTRKQGVVHKDILLPEHVPKEFIDRTKLWNSVELFEKTSNAQLARNFIIALPKELSLEENKKLIQDFIKENLLAQGMIVDYAIHSESREGNENIHAHIMTIVRPINEKGEWQAKSKKEYILDENGEPILTKSGTKKSRKIELTTWNDKGNVVKWRESFSTLCNQYLERNGEQKRVDHRSFKRQEVEQIPTIHMGAAASAMERKGIPTEKGNINREIKKQNQLIQSIKKEIKRLTEWIGGFSNRLQVSLDSYKQQKQEEIENKSELFDLYEYLSFYQEMQSKESQHLKYYAKQNKNVYDLKKFSQGVLYLRKNNLKTIADLQDRIDNLKTKNRGYFKLIKQKTERIDALNQCIRYGEIIKTNKPIYDEYQTKKLFKENFYKANQQAIDKYERARQQIKIRVGNSAVKPSEWQNEIKRLEKEIIELNNSSVLVKEEYQNINHIKYAVDHVNKEYGIDLSIEIDKAIKRGDKPSVIKQIQAFQEQQIKDEQYRQKAKDKNQER